MTVTYTEGVRNVITWSQVTLLVKRLDLHVSEKVDIWC